MSAAEQNVGGVQDNFWMIVSNRQQTVPPGQSSFRMHGKLGGSAHPSCWNFMRSKSMHVALGGIVVTQQI